MNSIENPATNLSSSHSPPTLPPRWRRDIYAPTYVPSHLLPVHPLNENDAYVNVETHVDLHMQCIGLFPSTFPPFTQEERHWITYLVLVFYWYEKHHSISEPIVDQLRLNFEITLKYHKFVDTQLHSFFQSSSVKIFPSFLLQLIQQSPSNHTALLTSLFQRCLDQPKALAPFDTLQTSIVTTLPSYLLVQVYLHLLKCLSEHSSSLSFPSSLEAELMASLLSKEETQACQSIACIHMYLRTKEPSWLTSALSLASPNAYLHLYVRWHVYVSGVTHQQCIELAQRSHPQHLVMDVSDLFPPPMYTEMQSTLHGIKEFLCSCHLHLKKLNSLKQFEFKTNLWEQCILLWVPSLDSTFEAIGTFSFSAEWLDVLQELVQFEDDMNVFRVAIAKDAAKIDFHLTTKCLDVAFTWLSSQKTFLMNLIDRTLRITLQDDLVDPNVASPFTESILTLFQACHSVFKALKQVPILLLRHHLFLAWVSILDSVLLYYFQSYKKVTTKALNAHYALEQYTKLLQLIKNEVPFPFLFIGERTQCMLREFSVPQNSIAVLSST